MNYSAILTKRRTIRFYQQKSVAEKHLLKMVEAACHAPSGANNQVLRYTIVRNRDLVQAIFYHTRYGGRVTPKRSPEWGVNAPTAFIAISAVKNGEAINSSVYADAGAAIMSMQFQAVEENLGTCWICAFEKKQLNEVMQVKAPWSVEAITPLGYGNVPPRDLNYKDIDRIFKVVK